MAAATPAVGDEAVNRDAVQDRGVRAAPLDISLRFAVEADFEEDLARANRREAV